MEHQDGISHNGLTNGASRNSPGACDENYVIAEAQLDKMFQDFESHLRPFSKLSEPDYEELRRKRLIRNEEAIATTRIPVARNAHVLDANYTNEEVSAAVCIQKHIRGFQARRFYVKLLQIQFEKNEAERRLKQMEQVEEGELLVENYHLETEIRDDIVALRNLGRRLHYHATVIQRAWREYHKRKNLIKEWEFNEAKLGGKEYLI